VVYGTLPAAIVKGYH